MILKKIKKKLQYLFKRSSQIFFFLIHGKIKSVVTPDLHDKISVFEVKKNDIVYRIFFINNGRIYTDRIDDTAFIIDNKIISGPSYQLRSKKNDKLSPRNNSKCIENSVFQKGTPRIKKNITGSVLSLLSGGGANNNYFHWLYDVLPRISFIDNLDLREKFPKFLLVPNYEHHFQKSTLEILGFKKKQILNSKYIRHLSSAKIIATDHPYNITNNVDFDHDKIPSWISDWLKNKFIKKDFTHDPGLKKIYIDRDDIDPKRNSERRITNEVELRKFLIKKNFKFIKLNEISFRSQVNIFNNAEIIIGLHGAGFANISFCKPGTRIVEFRSKNTGRIIENIANNNQLNFSFLEYEPKKFLDKQKGHLEISINEVKNII